MRANETFPAILKAYCEARGYPCPEAEHAFHPTRGWLFDFAWPTLLIALEIEGGTRLKGGGRHNRPKGYEEDARKYSEAALIGWKVLRCTWKMVNAGEVWTFIDRALSPLTPSPSESRPCPAT